MMRPTKIQYRNFLISFISFFFLFPLVLITFNRQVDPNHRYRFSIKDETLTQLAKTPDSVLTLPENYDDRALLKKFVKIIDSPVSIVLGGSRVLNIQASMFQKDALPLLNAGVTAGTIRDYVAIWQMIKSNHLKPRFVYIGIEEQSLNSVSQNDRYLSIFEHYEAFFQQGLSLRVKFMGLTTDFKDLLSLQTTLSSLKRLYKKKPETSKIISRGTFKGEQAARTSSFSVVYPTDYENKSVELTNRQGNANGQGELKVFEKWNSLDRKGYNQLLALIRDVKDSGAIPILIGMPYHPEAFRVIEQNPGALKNLYRFVKELQTLAEQEHVAFYDAILEHKSEFALDDFMDGVHLKAAPNYRLFKKASIWADYGHLMRDKFS